MPKALKGLSCSETGLPIVSPDSVLAISAYIHNGCKPISKKIIDAIPQEKSQRFASDAEDPGIDIYSATAEARDDGTYDPASFCPGKFLFSIPYSENALLPNSFKSFFKSAPKLKGAKTAA